jgi:hypothetical protein
MKCPGDTSLAESRNSEKLIAFVTLILVGDQGENLSFNKIFLLRHKFVISLFSAHCKCDIAPIGVGRGGGLSPDGNCLLHPRLISKFG